MVFKIGLRNDPWNYRFFPTEIAFFLAGVIAYKIYSRIKTKVKDNVYLLKIMFTIVLMYIIFFQFIPLSYWYKYFLYFLVVFITLPFVFLLTKDSKIDRYIGELSYPVYISHNFVMMMMTVLHLPEEGGRGISVTLLTLLFAVILNEFVAKKVEALRQKRTLDARKHIEGRSL